MIKVPAMEKLLLFPKLSPFRRLMVIMDDFLDVVLEIWMTVSDEPHWSWCSRSTKKPRCQITAFAWEGECELNILRMPLINYLVNTKSPQHCLSLDEGRLAGNVFIFPQLHLNIVTFYSLVSWLIDWKLGESNRRTLVVLCLTGINGSHDRSCCTKEKELDGRCTLELPLLVFNSSSFSCLVPWKDHRFWIKCFLARQLNRRLG